MKFSHTLISLQFQILHFPLLFTTMLPNWLQPRKHRHEISPESPNWPRRYSCSSFKDIQNLLLDDNPSPQQICHQPRSPKIQNCTSVTNTIPSPKNLTAKIPNGVVLYYTTLRIVRKTFEECRSVRSMLHRYRIAIDERDLSMDSKFREELESYFGSKKVSLPKVFIGGRCVGGAEEIKKMMESDELMKMIGDLPPSDVETCGMCRGWRFVLCEKCNGSHKIFKEKLGFVSCVECNVQGLIRCSLCFPVYRRRNSDCFGGLRWKSLK